MLHMASYRLAELISEPRGLRVFVAYPDDVAEERATLAKLRAEINDVLAYLAPDKRRSIELLRYETHSYPDIGAPQS
jgi:DNA-directed RNA polymerase specialized sigma24 family protein